MVRLVRVQSSIALALRFFSVCGHEDRTAGQDGESSRGRADAAGQLLVHRRLFLLAAPIYTIPNGQNRSAITFFDLLYIASQVLTPCHH